MKTYTASTIVTLTLGIANNTAIAFSPFSRSIIKESTSFQRTYFSSESPFTTPSNTYLLHQSYTKPSSSSLYYRKYSEEEDHEAVDKKEIDQVVVEKEKLVSKKQSRVISRSTPLQNIVTLETLDDFIDHMSSNKDKVVVARFSASWCRVRTLFFFILSSY